MSESIYASPQIIDALRKNGFASEIKPVCDVQILHKAEVKSLLHLLDRAYKTADKSKLVFK